MRSGPLAHPRGRTRVTASAVASALVLALAGTSAMAADEDRLNADVGYPVWHGEEDPVPELPVDATTGNQLQAVFDADVADGAGQDIEHDFWIDDMLARYGDAGGYGDTNNWLFTRGRAAYMYTHDPAIVGFGGSAAYWDELGVDSFYTVRVAVDGETVALAEKIEERKQTPSYWHSVFTGAGPRPERASITARANVAGTPLRLTAADAPGGAGPPTGTAPPAAPPAGQGEELTGVQDTKSDITTLYPRFSGAGFTAEDGALSQ